MIQTRTRNRKSMRLMDERLMRSDPLAPSKGIAIGGMLAAMIWGLLAVAIS